MKTTIDNNLRVLQIVTSVQHQVFCNPVDYIRISNELGLIDGYFKVYHFWNGKQKRISKKDLSLLLNSVLNEKTTK
jgi:hypothetical protein